MIQIRSITRPLMTLLAPAPRAPFALVCLGCFNGGDGDGGVTSAEVIEEPIQVRFTCATCGARYDVPPAVPPTL